MSALASLVDTLRKIRPAQQFEGHADIYVWAGATPQSIEPIQVAIAAKIGIGAPSASELATVARADAEVWLNLFARASLMHGIEKPETDDLKEKIGVGFRDLGTDARFYSNGEWTLSVGKGLPEVLRSSGTQFRSRRRHHYSWQQEYLSRMPDALKDGGIIGVGSSQSFLFWVSETD